MLQRSQKAEVIEGLGERFGRQRVSIFADVRGITVAKLAALRRELKSAGAELTVAKKTLLKRALVGEGLGVDPSGLEGEIGVIFGYADQIAPAKIAAKFSRSNPTFRLLAGILDRSALGPGEVATLAGLASREELLARLAGALGAPMRNLAAVLDASIRNLAVVLRALADRT